ncbi:hypothetical protein [Pelagovum pacificum]|uniref:Phage protein n=1 Tax=Pelagovum pacificum TaxID=2588711 RepID=A0A5C5GDT9_9RHOB|nr:hypothetical protein [Pelagovum pacificum]QQA43929.1 hypothetical protein I8N54_04950 [Pelagovum pacificum]TNY32942.1 hypothetical protein FHY64_06600 [Pelagovum pacificum]
MTKNKLTDLNDHLFAQLERMSDEAMSTEQLEQETKRATAIVSLSDQIIEGQKLRLQAAKLFADHGAEILPHLPQIGNSE